MSIIIEGKTDFDLYPEDVARLLPGGDPWE
jgi:hypothetical protein